MKIKELIDNIDYIKFIGNEEIIVNNFSKDTRTILEGDIYLGIKGENFDGNIFYQKAFENKASACILDNIDVTEDLIKYCIEENKAIIVVDDTVKRLQQYANSIRSKVNIPVVAITGSAGKTTTKDMVASIIKQKYSVLKSEQNYNNEIGCPLTITKYNNEEVMVLEMGTSSFGEIDILSKMAKPTVSLITNIGTAHIGLLGSRENILKAKAEIVNGMNEDGILIINNDDDMLHKYYLENKDKMNIITYGINEPSDFLATDVEFLENKCMFKCNGNLFEVPISGLHYVYNALSCIAVSSIFDINNDDIQKGFNNIELSKNRMSIIKKEDFTIINDAYNANAEAMIYALNYLSLQNGRKIAVLGSMLELGDYSKELHEKVAASCIDNKVDIILSIGEEMKDLDNYLEKNEFENHYHFESKEEILLYLKENKKPGDFILIKGSNGLRLFDLIDEI